MKDELYLIKSLIKKAISIVGDGEAKITLSNQDDCSLFISNLFGYKNWREVKNNIHSEKMFFKIEFDNIVKNKIENIEKIKLHLVDIALKKLQYSSLSSDIKIDSRLIVDNVDFGYSEDGIFKSDKVESAGFANTVIVSDYDNCELKKIFLNEKSGLIAPYIAFTETPNIDLDPWSIMLGSSKLEDFFGKFNDEFSPVFIAVIRDLYLNGLSVELKEIIRFLEIQNFISLLPILKEMKLPSYHLVKKFLKSIDVPIVDGSELLKDVQALYWEKIKNVYSSLVTLAFYYKEGVFKKMYSEDTLLEMLGNRKNIMISSMYVSHPLYIDFVQLSLDRALEIYSKSAYKSENHYAYWLYIDAFERFVNYDFDWIKKYNFLKTFVISKPIADSLNNLLLDGEQILLGKMNTFNISSDVRDNWLERINLWPNGFWYNSCSAIRNLNIDEYFYIKQQGIGSLNQDFKGLTCNKVRLLEN